MSGDVTGVQGVNHTWPCQWVIFSVNAAMGRRLTNQGTLQRKRTERDTEIEYITRHQNVLFETTTGMVKYFSEEFVWFDDDYYV